MPVIKNNKINYWYSDKKHTLDLSKAIKLENVGRAYNVLMPDKYYVFETGGYHPFAQCSPLSNIPQIYREPVWPWVAGRQDVHGGFRHMRPSISHNGYVIFNPRKIEKRKTIQEGGEDQGKLEGIMHRIVALAFCYKPDNYEELDVDHIDNNRVNYLPSNLRFLTRSENSKNKTSSKPQDMDNIYKRLKNFNWLTDPGKTFVKPAEDLIKPNYGKQLHLDLFND
jgi:hypothetical protein